MCRGRLKIPPNFVQDIDVAIKTLKPGTIYIVQLVIKFDCFYTYFRAMIALRPSVRMTETLGLKFGTYTLKFCTPTRVNLI